MLEGSKTPLKLYREIWILQILMSPNLIFGINKQFIFLGYWRTPTYGSKILIFLSYSKKCCVWGKLPICYLILATKYVLPDPCFLIHVTWYVLPETSYLILFLICFCKTSFLILVTSYLLHFIFVTWYLFPGTFIWHMTCIT